MIISSVIMRAFDRQTEGQNFHRNTVLRYIQSHGKNKTTHKICSKYINRLFFVSHFGWSCTESGEKR